MRNSDYAKQLKPSVKLDIKNKGIMVIKLVKYVLFPLNVFLFPAELRRIRRITADFFDFQPDTGLKKNRTFALWKKSSSTSTQKRHQILRR